MELSLKLYIKYIDYIENTNFKNLLIIKDPKYWKSLWLSAWIHFKKNDLKMAVKHFRKGIYSPIAPYRVANFFWLHKLENADPEHIEDFPFTYYYTRIKKAGVPDRGLKRFVELINGKQSRLFIDIVEDLKSLLKYNLINESFNFLNWAKNEKSLSESDVNVLKIIESILHLKKKDFYRAFSSLTKNFKNYISMRLPRFLRQIYTPVRYKHLIDVYSRINRVDRTLMYALIRDESFFRADVVSPSGAHGLTQLLLQTARRTARKHGIRIRRRDLYKPEINLRIGIEYFRFLMNKYNGKINFVLAAYNAGDHRVDTWINDFGNVSEEEFIEMIPLSETRNYVKNIFRNYYYYRLYYGR